MVKNHTVKKFKPNGGPKHFFSTLIENMFTKYLNKPVGVFVAALSRLRRSLLCDAIIPVNSLKVLVHFGKLSENYNTWGIERFMD